MRHPISARDDGAPRNVLRADRIDNAVDRFAAQHDGVVLPQEQRIAAGVDLFDLVQHGNECRVDAIHIATYGGAGRVQHEAGVRTKVVQTAVQRGGTEQLRFGNTALGRGKAQIIRTPARSVP